MLLRSSLPCMPSPLPRWNRLGALFARFPRRSQPSPFCGRVGFRISPFEACTAFTSRYGLRARQITYVILYTEGFGRFVASTTAPIATGWSESCRVGLPSHWGIAPFHGALESISYEKTRAPKAGSPKFRHIGYRAACRDRGASLGRRRADTLATSEVPQTFCRTFLDL